ncbi:unnamed protein product [Strongylus vulgaris]|nr:unnamed protein product [Strongylus vulgaris]
METREYCTVDRSTVKCGIFRHKAKTTESITEENEEGEDSNEEDKEVEDEGEEEIEDRTEVIIRKAD